MVDLHPSRRLTQSSSNWRTSPPPATLPVDRVDVWRLHLDPQSSDARLTHAQSSPAQFNAAQSSASQSSESPDKGILSSDELARASRFHFERDRRRFVCCRSVLRRLLGEYLSVEPRKIRLEYSANGKPRLNDAENPHELRFNVAHSGEQALIAFGTRHQLGVDIEKIRGDVETKSLAERFFSSHERVELRKLPEPLQVPAFFACWARKEAFLKATGDGLSFPLADFSVSVHPEGRPVMEEIKGSEQASKEWTLFDLEVGTGYRAAVAIDTLHVSIQTLAFPWRGME